MSPVNHAIISAGTSAVFWFFTKSFSGTVACFLSGIFIDLDHHLDYFLVKRELPLNYKKLLDFCENDRGIRPYLIFHSLELHILLWICIFYFNLGPVWYGLAVGITVHMIADLICNPVRPIGYFFIHRLKYGFKSEKFLTEADYKRRR